MIARLSSGALHGVDAFQVDLEVDFARSGLPGFVLVGLAEGAVREAKERVFSALRAANLRLPPGRITVNLAPADRRKSGSAYDLPLALGLAAAAGLIPPDCLQGWYFAAELSLAGELKSVPGILPLALLARSQGAKGLIVAPDAAQEAAVVEGLAVYAPTSLAQASAFLAGQMQLEPVQPIPFEEQPLELSGLDFAEVKGQEQAKRALEIAAAGAHNLLLSGPPGSGKSMLARRIPGILPPLSFEESLEVSKIYSVAGMLGKDGLIRQRPFRTPHHTISDVALIGGGAYPRPGEICLAHRGVLFLDELPEFQRSALEVLRQPLEEGQVTISRVAQVLTYPAQSMLVAAMNPCPCGYYGDPQHNCRCSVQSRERYRSRLSGPLLDRIDLQVEVPAVDYEDLRSNRPGADSATMRARIIQARQLQSQRYQASGKHCNAELSGHDLEKHCAIDGASQEFLGQAVRNLALSARSYTRILRIARTIADLEQSPTIELPHLAEAVNYRVLDRSRV